MLFGFDSKVINGHHRLMPRLLGPLDADIQDCSSQCYQDGEVRREKDEGGDEPCADVP